MTRAEGRNRRRGTPGQADRSERAHTNPDGVARRHRRHRWLIALGVVGLLALAGCGSAGSNPSAATADQPIGTGKVADFNFTATDLSGTTFEGSSLKGKPVVLWWWAPWCPTCWAESGNVSALAHKYHGQVAVVGVGGLDSGAAIRDGAARIPYVTHLIDPQGTVWQHFGVRAQSTYTVISADGEILAEGYLDDGQLNDVVARMAG